MFENMLNAHDDPVYKQITVEFFVVLCKIMKRHPEFSFIDTINVDTMINQAIKLYSEVSTEHFFSSNWNKKVFKHSRDFNFKS
jgi:hypothetical protein